MTEKCFIEWNIRQVFGRVPALVTEVQAEGDGPCEGVGVQEVSARHGATLGHPDHPEPAERTDSLVTIRARNIDRNLKLIKMICED
jgi:hypothetical protein